MTEELVRKCVEAIDAVNPIGCSPEEAVRAVIPVVLEEAAKVADAEEAWLREDADQAPGVPYRTEQRTAERIACEIRRLGSI